MDLADKLRRRPPRVLGLPVGCLVVLAAVVALVGVGVLAFVVVRDRGIPLLGVAVAQADPDKAAIERHFAKVYEPDEWGGVVRWHKAWVDDDGVRCISFRAKIRGDYQDFLAAMKSDHTIFNCQPWPAVYD